MVRRTRPLSVLVVCEANVCRSVAAQFALERLLPAARIESAGMHARPGTLVCEVVAESISGTEESGEAFAREFRSRRIEDVGIDDFDLVLAATSDIRADLARTAPHLRDRFFTIREAADVLVELRESEPSALTPTELVVAMNRCRGARATTGPVSPRLRIRFADPLDIPDAHGDKPRRHRAVVDLALDSAGSVGESLGRLGFS